MSENNTQTPAQEKPRRSKEDILEIIIAVFLGVTALATAWASWIGSLHGGNMSTNYTKSNNLAADGNARWNEASQTLMQDMQVWNMISDYQVEVLYADQTGSTNTKKRTNGTPAAKTWTVPGIRSNSTNNIPNRLTGPGSVKVSSVPGRLRNTSLSIRSWAGQ